MKDDTVYDALNSSGILDNVCNNSNTPDTVGSPYSSKNHEPPFSRVVSSLSTIRALRFSSSSPRGIMQERRAKILP